jgi:hypothetical protein
MYLFIFNFNFITHPQMHTAKSILSSFLGLMSYTDAHEPIQRQLPLDAVVARWVFGYVIHIYCVL